MKIQRKQTNFVTWHDIKPGQTFRSSGSHRLFMKTVKINRNALVGGAVCLDDGRQVTWSCFLGEMLHLVDSHLVED